MTADRLVWQEPVRGGYPGPEFVGLDGLERLRGVIRGEYPLPPISRYLGIRPVEAGVGTATFATPAGAWLTILEDFLSGGVVALAADAPASGAIATALAPGELLATSELTLNFLGAARPSSGALIGRGRLFHKTRTLGYASVEVEDTQGRLLAHGTTRCVIIAVDPELVPPQEVLSATSDTPDPFERPVPHEPLPRDLWREQTGLEVIERASSKQALPPALALLGLHPTVLEAGTVELRCPATGWLSGPERRVYGGVIAWLAHDALTLAVYSTLPAGTTQASLDVTVHFMRPGLADGRELRATGRVVRKGRTLAVAESEVLDADDRAIATAVGSVMLLEGRGWPGDARPYDLV